MASGSILRERQFFKLPCIYLNPCGLSWSQLVAFSRADMCSYSIRNGHEGNELLSTPGLFLADMEGGLKILYVYYSFSPRKIHCAWLRNGRTFCLWDIGAAFVMCLGDVPATAQDAWFHRLRLELGEILRIFRTREIIRNCNGLNCVSLFPTQNSYTWSPNFRMWPYLDIGSLKR